MQTQEMQKLRDQGYTYTAIGAKAGVSTQAVYTRLHPEPQREYQREYRKTPQHRKYERMYSKTPQYREYQLKYRKTPQYREYWREYKKTPQHREFQRHLYHRKVNRVFSNCNLCERLDNK
jgi:hypothetical protein